MAVGLCALALLPLAAHGQATAGQSSSMVIPLVSKSTSFESEVFVRNSNTFAISVDVLYYEATKPQGILPVGGLQPCAVLPVASNQTVSFKLGTQCPTTNDGLSHFGMLVLRDHGPEKIHTFAAFSRVQHVLTNQGFSVEGFPEHTFSGRVGGVLGLKRKAASSPPSTGQPGYSPNCFIGSLGEPINYTLQVRAGNDDSQIGNAITGTLEPYQIVRQLDVLAKAGAPAGDRENFRVRFSILPVEPAFVGFCTEQDNFSFGADFRIARSDNEANLTKLLTRCRGTSDAACTTLIDPPSYAIPNATTKHLFSLFVHHPDYLHCDIVGPNAANLEMRLLAPSSGPGGLGPPVAGGDNMSSFYYETGPRGEVVNANGFQTFWTLEIGPREGASAPTFPAAYGYRCFSGSGIHGGGAFSTLTDDF